jgi:hypothetical protein
MAVLARSVPWTQQPQVSAQAARGGQFSSGLYFLALPEQNGFVDVISGGRDNGGGSSYPHYVNSGTIIRNPPTVNNGFQTKTALDSINGPFTLFTEFRLNSQSRQTAFISADLGTGAGFGIGLDWSDFVSKGIQYWNGGSTHAVSAAGAFVDEFRMVRIAITHDGATLKFFSGGMLHSSVANTTLPAANTNRKTYIMGSYFGANSFGSTSIAAAWNRPLSDSEIRAVSANPWQLFAPMRRFMPSAAVSAFPTLSGLTFIDITANSARPRVTITF